MQLADRTILVTGASSGVGAALVEHLLGLGSRVIAVSRRHSPMTGHANLTGIEADLSDPGAIKALVTRLATDAADLSIIINNAGIQCLSDFVADAPATLVQRTDEEIALNLIAPINLTALLMPQLKQRDSAAIVNITSGLALSPKRSAPVYCATKAGLRAFTRSLRFQCERDAPHLRVIEALPPLVDTAMTTGRGNGKISAAQCAAEIIDGIMADKMEIRVGKTKLLHLMVRFAPALAERITKAW